MWIYGISYFSVLRLLNCSRLFALMTLADVNTSFHIFFTLFNYFSDTGWIKRSVWKGSIISSNVQKSLHELRWKRNFKRWFSRPEYPFCFDDCRNNIFSPFLSHLLSSRFTAKLIKIKNISRTNYLTSISKNSTSINTFILGKYIVNFTSEFLATLHLNKPNNGILISLDSGILFINVAVIGTIDIVLQNVFKHPLFPASKMWPTILQKPLYCKTQVPFGATMATFIHEMTV